MKEEIYTKNAIIDNAYFDTERVLSAWIVLHYGDGTYQEFGGWILYAPTDREFHAGPNFAGHFIWRVLQVTGATDWNTLKGKPVRVKCSWTKAFAIGHIIKDDWFDPEEEFKRLRVK